MAELLVTNPRIRRRVQFVPVGESRVEQSHRDECDINKIMARYHRSGLLPGRGEPGYYGDFTAVDDYQDAVERVFAADRAFMELPSAVRKRFANDPSELLAFLADEGNRDEAVELGIIPPLEPVVEDVGSPDPDPVPE